MQRAFGQKTIQEFISQVLVVRITHIEVTIGTQNSNYICGVTVHYLKKRYLMKKIGFGSTQKAQAVSH